MRIELTTEPKKEDIQKVLDILVEFNRKHFEILDKKEIALYAKEDNEIVGGITGEIFGNWLEINYLAVSESFRGQGIGRKLLEKAEAAALETNCRFVFLSTFDFQAKGFYQKQGYREVFALEDYPLTGKEHFLVKELKKGSLKEESECEDLEK